MKRPALIVTMTAALAASSCRTPAPRLAPDAVAHVTTAVTDAVRAVEAADRARDAEALIARLTPDFYMYQDGQRTDRATIVAQIRATLPTLRAFDTRFDAIEILPITTDAAVVSMQFDDAITAADGTTTRSHGVTTTLWRRAAAGWQMAYVQAHHLDGPAPRE
ncbi:MAG: nuclear transport factor 2 family protein [Planctomycetota bacterium]